MFLFLTVLQAIVAAALVGVILMQRSEGGGLGIGGGGGGPGGLLSARGAADFLTRTTAILATVFVILSIILAAVAVESGSGREIQDTLDRTVTPAEQPLDPLAVPAGDAAAGGTSEAAPASDDPLAGAAE